MSGPISYAIAAGSAASKDLKDSMSSQELKEKSDDFTEKLSEELVEKVSDSKITDKSIPQSNGSVSPPKSNDGSSVTVNTDIATGSSTTPATTATEASSTSTPETSTNQSSKPSLTPAPVPKVNVWKIRQAKEDPVTGTSAGSSSNASANVSTHSTPSATPAPITSVVGDDSSNTTSVGAIATAITHVDVNASDNFVDSSSRSSPSIATSSLSSTPISSSATPALSTSIESPGSAKSQPQSAASTTSKALDASSWPKPDESASLPLSEKKDAATPIVPPVGKLRNSGKEKWVPFTPTIVLPKPAGSRKSGGGPRSSTGSGNGPSSKSRGAQSNSKGHAAKQQQPKKASANQSGSAGSITSSSTSGSSTVISSSVPSSTNSSSGNGKLHHSTQNSSSDIPNFGQIDSDSISPSETPQSEPDQIGQRQKHKSASISANTTISSGPNGFHYNNHHNSNGFNQQQQHHHYPRSNSTGHQTFNPQQIAYVNGSGGSNPRRGSNFQKGSHGVPHAGPGGPTVAGPGGFYIQPDYAALYNQQLMNATPYEVTIGLIIAQIEYYLSVENLCKDIYLRRQMNSLGFIPLTVLASFNRVKSLTNGDFNLFVDACRWSPSAEVVGDRIRPRFGWETWVLPANNRLPAGRDDDANGTDKLVFNAAAAVPFIPKSESA